MNKTRRMEFTELKIEASLDHLGFESEDPRQLAEFYAKTMKMEIIAVDENTWHCLGPERLLVFVAGRKNKLAFVCFSCRDENSLSQIKEMSEKNGLDSHPFESIYLEKGSFSIIDPDENRISFGVPLKRKPNRSLLYAPLQHLSIQSKDVGQFTEFYQNNLGFAVSDRVINKDGVVTTCFLRSNHEHHTLACFKSEKAGVDHHSYEVGKWNLIRDWCDHFSSLDIKLFWGPGRHGPGNNLFVFIEDCDENRVELSAELEIINGRKSVDWAHEPRTLNLWGEGLMRS